MSRATLLGRLADPATRLIAVGVSVGVLVAIQVIVLVSGGIIATREANKAIDDSFAYLADVSEERVVVYAGATQQVASETAKTLELANPGAAGLLGTLHGALTSRPQVESVSVTYPSGNFAELSHAPFRGNGYSSHVISVDRLGEDTHKFGEFDVQMRPISDYVNSIKWDPRTARCYERATRAASVVWSEPEVNPLTGRVQVWACAAARTPDGAVFAVVSAAVDLADLGRVLNLLPSGSDGRVYVLSDAREVLATPQDETADWRRLSARMGAAPTVTDLHITTSNAASSGTADDAFGADGKLQTLERGLANDGVGWVVHLRATELGVNEGFTRLRSTVIAIVVGLIALTLGTGYLLSRMWRPLRSVRDVAERDPLTGLYNRHHVEARIARSLESARRGGHEAVVIMLDLDNFKALNDDLGHAAGDTALEDISAVLATETRASDIAVRWGGDEFLVVLRLPRAADARGAVERIRSRAELALRTRFAGRQDLGVTAGFAVGSDAESDIDQLIAAADAALVDGKWLKKGATYGP